MLLALVLGSSGSGVLLALALALVLGTSRVFFRFTLCLNTLFVRGLTVVLLG